MCFYLTNAAFFGRFPQRLRMLKNAHRTTRDQSDGENASNTTLSRDEKTYTLA